MTRTDTPPAKAGRFSLVASYLGPCQGRYSDGTEILDGVGLHLAVAPVRRFGADVVRPVHVSVPPRRSPDTESGARAARRAGRAHCDYTFWWNTPRQSTRPPCPPAPPARLACLLESPSPIPTLDGASSLHTKGRFVARDAESHVYPSDHCPVVAADLALDSAGAASGARGCSWRCWRGTPRCHASRRGARSTPASPRCPAGPPTPRTCAASQSPSATCPRQAATPRGGCRSA